MYSKKMYLVIGLVMGLLLAACVPKSEFEQVENELTVNQGQLETTQNQLEVLQEQYNLLEEQHTILQMEQEALDSTHAALKIDHAALEESLAALTINRDSLQDDHDRTLNHLTMVQAQVEDLRRILEREQDALADVQEQIQHASAMIDFVRGIIKSCGLANKKGWRILVGIQT
jgi:chromosome segregation ATPase